MYQKEIVAFKHPFNDYIEEVNNPAFWCFFLHTIYFIYMGVWRHVVLSFIFGSLLINILFITANRPVRSGDADILQVLFIFLGIVAYWGFYSYKARSIVEKDFLRKGWIPVYGDGTFGTSFMDR